MDYDVVLGTAIDGTAEMVAVVDGIQHPHPSMELSFVERIREHPQRVYGGQLQGNNEQLITWLDLGQWNFI